MLLIMTARPLCCRSILGLIRCFSGDKLAQGLYRIDHGAARKVYDKLGDHIAAVVHKGINAGKAGAGEAVHDAAAQLGRHCGKGFGVCEEPFGVAAPQYCAACPVSGKAKQYGKSGAQQKGDQTVFAAFSEFLLGVL